MQQVKSNDKVKLHYTCKTSDGKFFSTKEKNSPFVFTLGDDKMLPSFEAGIVGMKINEKKTINIPFEKAYGPVREDLFLSVNKTMLPAGCSPEIGTNLLMEQAVGEKLKVKVSRIMDNSVIVDANHPLAGKNLQFEVEVIEIF